MYLNIYIKYNQMNYNINIIDNKEYYYVISYYRPSNDF